MTTHAAKIISLIMLSTTVLLCVNAFLSNWLDYKTKFRRELMWESNWLILSYAFFGIILIFFIKQLKQYRKDTFLMDRLRLMKRESLTMEMYPDMFENIWGKDYKECQDHIRYKKLKKLQRKSKPNLLKKIYDRN